MVKGNDLIGRPIIALDRGVQVDHVKGLIVDRTANRLVGLMVDAGGLFGKPRVLPLTDIRAFGVDAIMVSSANVIVQSDRVPEIKKVMEQKTALEGMPLLTTAGDKVGTISDTRFDERTGQLEGFEVSSGLFPDPLFGPTYLSADEYVRIGEDVAIVSADLEDQLLLSETTCEEAVSCIDICPESRGETEMPFEAASAATEGEAVSLAGPNQLAGRKALHPTAVTEGVEEIRES